MNTDILAQLPLWYVAFLLSLTAHEAAHSLAAKLGGDLTAYHAGQVTLNPLPHIQREPFGTVIVPLLSFLMGGWMIGWGSAPYDPFWEHRHPKRASAMALAGPAANFTLVIIAAIVIHIGMALGYFQIPGGIGFSHITEARVSGLADGVAAFVSIVFSLNLLLGLFNLIPVAPLDGHSAIGLLLPEGLHRKYVELVRQPMFSLLGILVAWNVFDHIFFPVFRTAIVALYGGGFR
ncbi:MAG: site-2 protease family protein [Bryobacterales bacterium]|nr:site-2 protease family protein [Bryobacterales bacterium]